MTKLVRIGCASGFWGDTATAAPQLVRRAEIDYLVFDYLSEITMSIMARARARAPATGYATDFATMVMPRIMRELAQKRIRVVTNAGGVNPLACGDVLRRVARELGVELRIAVVLGDDLMPHIDRLRAAAISEMYSGRALPTELLSANAYLGAVPIAAALDAGADIVITGRCVDSALALGPLLHEFRWALDDYDRLAAGSLAGHVIECGAQATGGLFTDWGLVKDWENIGYPIVECASDGSFTVTKPKGTGGLVSVGTISEQILYEVGDPSAYELPDVACDFTQVRAEQLGPDRVRVEGARGRAPSPFYKVSATHADGYRWATSFMIIGIDAAAKAKRTGEAILARTRRMLRNRQLGDYPETNIEVLGAEHVYGPHAATLKPREVMLRLSAKHDQREALELLAREAMVPVTSMAPGTTGYVGGRNKVESVIRLFSFLLPKNEVAVTLNLGDGAAKEVSIPQGQARAPAASLPPAALADTLPNGPTLTLPLIRLAYARSGDKGDSASIGVIARRPEFLPIIRAALTEPAVAGWFSHLCRGTVTRYEVPGIHAMNFVLSQALGGGGVESLRIDPQGKGFAQMLLDYPVPVPVDLAHRYGLAA